MAMTPQQKIVYDLNNMNVAAQNAKLGDNIAFMATTLASINNPAEMVIITYLEGDGRAVASTSYDKIIENNFSIICLALNEGRQTISFNTIDRSKADTITVGFSNGYKATWTSDDKITVIPSK